MKIQSGTSHFMCGNYHCFKFIVEIFIFSNCSADEKRRKKFRSIKYERMNECRKEGNCSMHLIDMNFVRLTCMLPFHGFSQFNLLNVT